MVSYEGDAQDENFEYLGLQLCECNLEEHVRFVNLTICVCVNMGACVCVYAYVYIQTWYGGLYACRFTCTYMYRSTYICIYEYDV